MPNRLSKIDIDRNIRTIPHARNHSVAWVSGTKVNVTPVARALETTRKESAIKNTRNQALVCPMTADLVRTQLRYRLTTEKVELDIPYAVALSGSDPVLAIVIPGGLETPLGIVLDLVQDFRSSWLEICNVTRPI